MLHRCSGASVGVLVCSMLLWPSYLTISIGVSEMSVPRVVAIFLLLKFIIIGRHKVAVYNKIDILVICIWLWTIIANIVSGSEFSFVSQMIGRGFDTVLMYFVARFGMTSSREAMGIVPWIMITAFFMCVVGAYESIMFASPYQGMISYREWSWINKPPEYRWGLLRAKASTSVSIYFGMAMVVILGFLWSFREYRRSSLFYGLAIGSATIATLSSMSSGPWIACALLAVLSAYERKVELIKPTVFLIIIASFCLEVISNRHFYNLIDYIALDSHNAWYRTRLIEVAISQWAEYWLIGVGGVWPHHWAALLDGRGHIDIVNNFLIITLYGGIPALFMYLLTHCLILKKSITSWKESNSNSYKKMVFGFVVTLIALNISSISVGLFGPVLLLSYILVGFTSSALSAWELEEVGLDENEIDGLLGDFPDDSSAYS